MQHRDVDVHHELSSGDEQPTTPRATEMQQSQDEGNPSILTVVERFVRTASIF